MKATCKVDIVSGKGEKYASKGTEIEVYKQPHPEVFLCEYKGVKFPCASNKLEYDTESIDKGAS